MNTHLLAYRGHLVLKIVGNFSSVAFFLLLQPRLGILIWAPSGLPVSLPDDAGASAHSPCGLEVSPD